MKKQKQELINHIKNIRNENYVNALYEVVINDDYDYIENLFPIKADFDEFIAKYRFNCECAAHAEELMEENNDN